MGRIKDIVLAFKLAECFMNFIAVEDLFPKGGFPIICKLSFVVLSFKKFRLTISLCSGLIS